MKLPIAGGDDHDLPVRYLDVDSVDLYPFGRV